MSNLENLNLAEPFPGKHIVEDEEGNFYEVIREMILSVNGEDLCLPSDVKLARSWLKSEIITTKEALDNIILQLKTAEGKKSDKLKLEKLTLSRNLHGYTVARELLYCGYTGTISERVVLLNPEDSHKKKSSSQDLVEG